MRKKYEDPPVNHWGIDVLCGSIIALLVVATISINLPHGYPLF